MLQWLKRHLVKETTPHKPVFKLYGLWVDIEGIHIRYGYSGYSWMRKGYTNDE